MPAYYLTVVKNDARIHPIYPTPMIEDIVREGEFVK